MVGRDAASTHVGGPVSAPNVSRVFKIIREIEDVKSEWLRFIPSRFPYTYAFDYMRVHRQAFGMGEGTTRAAASRRLAEMVPGPEERRRAAVLLAKAYLDETKTNMNGHRIHELIMDAMEEIRPR